jgi:hypothetical protein
LSFRISLIVGFVTALFANTQAKWLLCGLMVLEGRWVYARLKENVRSTQYFLSEWCCPLSFIAAVLLVPLSGDYACAVKCVLCSLALVGWGDVHRYYAPKHPDESDPYAPKHPDENDSWLTDGLSLGSVAKKSAVNKQAARQAAARRESAQLRAAKRKAESEERAMKRMQTEKEAATKEAEKRAAAKKTQVEERDAAKKRAVASAAARRELERKEAEKRAEVMKEEQMKDAARKVAEKTQVPIAE